MTRYGRIAGFLLVTVVLLGLASPPQFPEPLGPRSAWWAASPAPEPSPPDTLRSATPPGTPLILSLPNELNDAPVTHYSILQGPSLSGVAGRSFTWIPRDAEPGTYDVRLRAHPPDAQPDTLVLRITVES